jgi:hypothetical protein
LGKPGKGAPHGNEIIQYENRLRDFDFDIMVANWPQALSPGNEQRDLCSSQAADTPGSRNSVPPPLRRGVLRTRLRREPWRPAEQGRDGGQRAAAKDEATGEAQGKPPGSQAPELSQVVNHVRFWLDRQQNASL